MILAGAVGLSILVISLCCCAYCWRRAANLSKSQPNAEQTVVGKSVQGCSDQDVAMQGTVVVGHPAQQVKPGNGSAARTVAFPPTDTGTGAEAV